MKHKKHHGARKHHTGKISHGNAHLGSHGGHDPHASAEHKKHNKAHGMAEGFGPKEGSDMDGEGGENYCHE